MRTLFTLILATVISGCSNKLYESEWRNEDREGFRFYHPESKIRYNVEHDSSHVYFSFDVQDQRTILKILTTGMRVFVDGSGKKKERNTEIQLPIYSDKVPLSEVEQFENDRMLALQAGERSLARMTPQEGYFKDGNEVQSIFNGADHNGLLVTIRFDSTRSLVYEARIPFDIIDLDENTVSIGLETGSYALPEEDQGMPGGDVTSQQRQPTPGDRAMGRGMGSPYGLNSPGQSTAAGMAMRNRTSFNEFAEAIRFWVQVRIISK